jgi:hypothetical protein
VLRHIDRIVTDDPSETAARLFLSEATRVVLRNGLTLLGMSTPDRMQPPHQGLARRFPLTASLSHMLYDRLVGVASWRGSVHI